MKKRYLILPALVFFVLASLTALAQQRTITGSIKDPQGNGLPGVNVVVKGTSLGTVTDAAGAYTLAVPDGSTTLVFSFIGYASKEAEIGSQSTIDVTLEEDVKQLSEVVVTALGIERNAKALQSSVTQIGGENFTQARENNMANNLAGRVAGVNVTKVSSGPAGSSRVVIRGAKTLQGLNQPLYVIDGIPMDNTQFAQSGVWGGPDNGDGMNSVNPDDIQSMTVLKGASAAALYGSRAANGVILVTTKKGSARKGIGIEFNSNYVFEKLNDVTDFQKSYGSGAMTGPDLETRVATTTTALPTDQSKAFDGGWYSQAWGPKFDGHQAIQFDGQVRPYSYTGNNFKPFFQTGSAFTNSLSFTGGSETQSFRVSIANLKSAGIIPNTGFDRMNVTLSESSKFGKKVTFTSKVMYSHETAINRPMLSDSPGNAVQAAYVNPGDVDIRNYKGDPNKLGAIPVGMVTPDAKAAGEELQPTSNLWGQNPYWAAYQFINSDVRDRVIMSGQLRYDITDFLYAEGKFGMDWYTKRGTNLTPQGTGYQRGGGMTDFEQRNQETNLQWLVGFNKSYSKIGVNAFIGGNTMRSKNENMNINGLGFAVPFFAAITNVAQKNWGYNIQQNGINSLFGSAEVSYDNFFYLTATARQDWFSVLNYTPPAKNHIFYPSVGGSFVFSDAFQGLPGWLSFGKVRASWGRVGNGGIGPYSTNLAYGTTGGGSPHLGRPLATFTAANGNNGTLPNPLLVPWLSEEVEIGFDLRFLDNRIGIDLAYYSQKTTKDILAANISRTSGWGSTYVNIGEITNKGIELLLRGTPVKGPITWDISLNFAKNTNRVQSLIQGNNQLFVEEPRTRTAAIYHVVGRPYGSVMGLVQDKTPDGKLVYDADGQPLSTTSVYQYIGNGVPDFTGGLTNSVTWKGINVSVLTDFKYGGKIYSGTNVRQTEGGFTKQTLQGRLGEAPLTVTGAIQTGTDGTTGEPIYADFTKTLTPGQAQSYWSNLGERAQDRFIYDASFIKLRQLTAGYTFPKVMLGKLPFQTLMVSFVARNLAIISKKVPNIDPEATYTSSNAQGLDYYGMPPTRSYGFNIRATF